MSREPVSERVSVPLVDLPLDHVALRDDLLARVGELLDSGAFVGGTAVAEFETSFAAYVGSRFCVGVSSGLDALRLAFLAAGIEPGDEVIVPANTFVATFEAVVQAGGVPVPVDVSLLDYNLDPDAARAAVTPRTRFVCPVHLYGQMTEMRAVRKLAASSGLLIVEDACQAHGARRDGLAAGTVGAAGAFSFYPAKNLGAIGDAGAVVTDDAALASDVRMLREHGQREKYLSERIGWTARLDAVQAVVLSAKLPHLDAWNEQRQTIAEAYGEKLAGVGDLVLPAVAPGSRPVWHLYVVRTRHPGQLADFLRSRGVHTGRHYPEPAHLSQAYASLGYARGAFPVTEALADEVISLPIFPGMTEPQVEAVVETIHEYFDHS